MTKMNRTSVCSILMLALVATAVNTASAADLVITNARVFTGRMLDLCSAQMSLSRKAASNQSQPGP
jgi:hypothetical protein